MGPNMTKTPSWRILLCLVASIPIHAGQQSAPQATVPPSGSFSFLLRFGVGAKNVLDTANGKFTKETRNGPVTTDLRLSAPELEQVQKKLAEIDFGNAQKFPQLFTVPDARCTTDPHHSMFLAVTQGSVIKEVTWQDMSGRQNCQYLFTADLKPQPDYLPADGLRELVELIDQMIQSKPEYQNLPSAPVYF
jgi:hypothetical protein